MIPESKCKSAVDKSVERPESPPTFTNKYREDSYCGPKLPLNAFQCYLKALKNHTTKQARDKWSALPDDHRQKYISMAKLDQQRFDVEMELQQLTNQQIPQIEVKGMKDEKSGQPKVAKTKTVQQSKKVYDLDSLTSTPAGSKNVKDKKPQVQSQLSMDKNSSAVKFVKQKSVIQVQEPVLGKVTPKMYKNPFIAFVQLSTKDKQGGSGKDNMKACGEAWNKMTPQEKQKYVDISEKDKARYHRELEELKLKGSFTNAEGVCSSTLQAPPPKVKKGSMKLGASDEQSELPNSKSRKKSEKPNQPKKAKTSYMCFMQENAKKTMEELKTTKCSDAAKLLGERWQKMSDQEKKPYVEMVKADVARYEKQMKEFKELGYFTLEDGSKSTDPKKPPLKRTHGEANQSQDSHAEGGQVDSELGLLMPNSKKQRVN